MIIASLKEIETDVTPTRTVQISEISSRKDLQTIFDNVKKEKAIIVEKNGKISGVIISPEEYEAYTEYLEEELEDEQDIKLLEERMKNFDPSKTISQEELMKKFGITQEDLDACEEVEIE